MSDYIPSELMPNILARLQIDDVLRCTSVCKSWYELITSSDFISLHLNLSISNTQTRLLVSGSSRIHLYRDNETFEGIPEFNLKRKLFLGLHFYGSSNGLFCFSDDLIRITLWNPSLRKSLLLPISRHTELLPSSQINLGFSFLPSTNDYKVVRILYTEIPGTEIPYGGFIIPPEVEIYDSRTRSWRDVDVEFSYVLEAYVSPVVLKGILYWEAINTYRVGGTFRRLIASFDLSTERFGALMLPKSLHDNYNDRLTVSMLKESLCLIHSADGFYSIYVMKECGIAESWEKPYHIENNSNFVSESLTPLYFRENGEILSELRSKVTYHHLLFFKLVSYDPISKKITDLGIRQRDENFFFVHDYVDSLFLIQDSNLQG